MTNAVNLASVAGNGFLRNVLINGAMQIDQRYGGAATANTINGYTLDRWSVLQSTGGKLIARQNAGAVTPPTNFQFYLGVTSQSSYSVGASDYYLIRQPIEGYNCARFGFGTSTATSITLSFWVMASLTGSFSAVISNGLGSRSYGLLYTINAANTWEYKTLTFPGDTSGTWGTSNGIGMLVDFGLGVGSSNNITAGSWQAANGLGVTGATSVVGTNGATFYITGVQLEEGTAATPFERRLYPQELALCQRYYQVIGSGSLGRYGSSTSCELFWMTSIPMRASPTVAATTNAANLFRVGLASGTTSTFSAASNGGTNKGGCWIVTFSGGVSPSAGEFAALVTDSVSLSAEL